ncbi:energy transducer TonB [Chitinibacter sp. GC72]|uniref:energy transducer TonB n=1 Tax=Chitinibacter sp. GC72 TaxID=1526917 RepID=UPI0012FBC0FA|nr:TonB family protein [Chitinibacter sp. GC72]
MTLSWKWIVLLSLLIHASLIVWLPYTPPERASAVMMVFDLAPVPPPAPSDRTTVQQSAVQPAPQAVKQPGKAPLPPIQPGSLVSKQPELPAPATQQSPSASAPVEKAQSEAAAERMATERNPAASAGPQSTAASKVAESGNSGPALLRHPTPEIPRQLRQLKANGTVRLRIVLAASGEVREVEIMQSSGYDAFDQVARKQVLNEWTFRAARRGGVAVESELIVPLRMQVIDEAVP